MKLNDKFISKYMLEAAESITNKDGAFKKTFEDDTALNKLMEITVSHYGFRTNSEILGLAVAVYCVYKAIQEQNREHRELCRDN